MVMIAWCRILIVALSVGSYSISTYAQSRAPVHDIHLNEVDLRTNIYKEIRVDHSVRSLVIDVVLVSIATNPNKTALLRISGSENSGSGDRQDRLNVTIREIKGGQNGAPLKIHFGGVRLGSVQITASGNSGSNAAIDLEIEQDDDSTVSNLDLRGGRYRQVHIVSDISKLAHSKQDPAQVTVVGASFHEIRLSGSTAETPVRLNIDANISAAPRQGAPSFRLYNLNVLEGHVSIGIDGVAGDLPPKITPRPGASCDDDASRLLVGLNAITIGEAFPETRPGWPGLLDMVLTGDVCGSISINYLKSYGEVRIKGHFIDELTLANSSDGSGNDSRFVVETGSLSHLLINSFSVGTLKITESNEEPGLATLDVRTWRTLRASGPVTLPARLYRELGSILPHSPTPDLARFSGVREFLVSTRWRSYTSRPADRATHQSMHDVVQSDTQIIFGSVLSTCLEWFTGFGIDLRYPLLTFLAYILLPPLIIPTLLGIEFRQGVMQHVSLLVFGVDTNSATPTSVKWLGLAARIQRLLIVLQVTLVSLFIQNIVLVGA